MTPREPRRPGRPALPLEERRQPTLLRLPARTREQLAELAEREGTSQARVVERLVDEAATARPARRGAR